MKNTNLKGSRKICMSIKLGKNGLFFYRLYKPGIFLLIAKPYDKNTYE